MDYAVFSPMFYVILFAKSISEVASIDCSEDRLASCYTSNNLTYKEGRPDQEIAGISNYRESCNKADAFTKALTCSLQYKHDCQTYIYPDVEEGKHYVDMACGSLLKHWDYKCVKATMINVASCPQPTQSLRGATVEVQCRAFDASTRCAASIFKTCGCASVKIITDILQGPGHRKECGESNFQRFQCDPDNPLKFWNGGTSIIPCWTLFMTFVNVIVTIFTMLNSAN